MLLHSLTILLLLLLAGVSSGQDAVTFYSDDGFSGNVLTSCNSPCEVADPPDGWNDVISSMKVPEGLRVQLFVDDQFQNEGYFGSTHVRFGEVASMEGGWNDDVSSWKVFAYNETAAPLAWLYRDNNYMIGSAAALPAGQYFASDLEWNHIGNDALSSIIIPNGVTITLYTDDYFQGQSTTYVGPTQIPLLPDPFQDSVSSCQIDINVGNRFSNIVGYWQDVGSSNAPISQSITVGTESSDSDARTTSWAYSLTVSMETGFDFLVDDSKVTVSQTLSESVAQTVSQTFTQSVSETCATTCPNDGGGIVYLFQWNMQATDAMGVSTVYTCNWICKNNPTPPACPLNACATPECDQCYPFQ